MVSLSLNTLVILIIVIVVLVAVLGFFFGYFNIGLFRRYWIKNKFCDQLMNNYGCLSKYLSEEKYSNKLSVVKCYEIEKVECKGGEYATFKEVCEFLGFRDWNDCIKNCNCVSFETREEVKSEIESRRTPTLPQPV